jgi:hypothetical protein
MSLFEAIEFSRLGYDTELLLPFEDHQSYAEFLKKNGISSLDDLSRFGGRFSITPVFPDGENFRQCDVLVYQSYTDQDWARFSELCRKHARVMTKSFPKFVASPDLDHHVQNQFRFFDVLACALREDCAILSSVQGLRDAYPDSFAYVPRGASPELLHAGYKASLPPTIGVDAPNKPVIEPLQHYVGPIKRLRRDYPELQVISIGREVRELDSSKVPYGRFDRLYEQFFNKIHVYCTINYGLSPDHTRASVQQIAPGWAAKAIYEVQNIEAQMSGAILVGHRDNLIPELYIPGITGLNFSSFSDEENIYRTLKAALQNWQGMVANLRRFSEDNFSWSHCVKLWSDAIQRRYSSLR